MRHQVIFVMLTENSGTSETSTPPEIAVETHFHVPHSTKTTSLFSTADAETYWSLLPSSISLLLDGTVQSENTYTYT